MGRSLARPGRLRWNAPRSRQGEGVQAGLAQNAQSAAQSVWISLNDGMNYGEISAMTQPLDVQQFLLAVDLKTTDYAALPIAFTMPDAIADEFVSLTGQTAVIGQTRTTSETSSDLFQTFSNAWNGFYDSGQIWALLIGIVLGYAVRSLTAY